jgi:hypothetical protein
LSQSESAAVVLSVKSARSCTRESSIWDKLVSRKPGPPAKESEDMVVPELIAKTSFISFIPDFLKALVSCAWVVLAGLAFWKFQSSLKAAIDSKSFLLKLVVSN